MGTKVEEGEHRSNNAKDWVFPTKRQAQYRADQYNKYGQHHKTFQHLYVHPVTHRDGKRGWRLSPHAP